MTNSIHSISLDKLVAHPGNANRMSSDKFGKLVRNIERTGRYEPLVVRPHPAKGGFFEIINGNHRSKALAKLGRERADCVVWDVDDAQADILLATLNRLVGSDRLEKKLALLGRLRREMDTAELSKFLPYTKKQIEKLAGFKIPDAAVKTSAEEFAVPLVFFVNDAQRQIIENALLLVEEPRSKMPKAAKRASALAQIARYFLGNSTTNSGGFINGQAKTFEEKTISSDK